MRKLLPAACAAALLLAAGSARPAVDAERSHFPNTPARLLTREDLRVAAARPLHPGNVESEVEDTTVVLEGTEGLLTLKRSMQQLLELGELQARHEEAHPERYLPFPADVSSGGKRRALREIIALTDDLLAGAPNKELQRRRLHLLELVNAVDNGFRYPVEKNHQLLTEVLPMLLFRGRQHLSVARAAEPEGDPAPSSFWAPGGDLRAQDLYAGFGRTALPQALEGTCAYLAPKTGWGAHSGFHVRCGGTELRFKLGDERFGGPFNTRIFDALGYRTHPIDRAPALRLAYDRRVFLQFHSRKRLVVRARLLFIPLKTHVITDEDDPFDLVDHAVMKDGREVAGPELRRKLLKDGRVVKGQPRPETVAENYQPDYEAQIEALVWKAGTAALETDDVKQIGAWDYDQLDHAERREVRGVFVLAAWLDQFNMRWENTRCAYVKEGGTWELHHLFSDVGSGLGLAQGLTNSRNSDVEAMLWEVTQERRGTVRFTGFAVNVANDAFERMTWGDARWMLRRLAAFSEGQILDGLLPTGMSAAEVRLALEKLLSKRRKMLLDFGLLPEFPEIAARAIDRALDFDPRDAAQLSQVSRQAADGTRVVPPAGGWAVVRGHLVSLPGGP